MRTMLVLTLVMAMACAAVASESTLALFFDVEAQRNNSDLINFDSEPAYLVLLNSPAEGINGFEFGMQITAPMFGDPSWAWPAGYTAYGAPPLYPQVVGLPGDLLMPDANSTILLGTLSAIYTGGGDILLGPKSPPDIDYPFNPVILDYTGQAKFAASLAIDPGDIDAGGFGIMATIQGEGVVATEETTLSSVKALFQ